MRPHRPVAWLSTLLAILMGGADRLAAEDAVDLAARVTIHRDAYGVPHIIGETDEATLFGFGYAQAEDYFWQVEDSYLLALGRYSEAHGPRGLNSDLLNRAFEIVPRSEQDFAGLAPRLQGLAAAFVGGINHYLDTHPRVRPRLLKRFEPWHVLAHHRHTALELTYRFTGLSTTYLPRRNPRVWAATGSNGWAVTGRRTASGAPMLLASPHLPWFGFTQLAEGHLISKGQPEGDGWNFTGAGVYGSPSLAVGHNEHLGWTLVSNEPDIADVWRVRFTHPDDPLRYEHGGGWRRAERWTETVRVKKSSNWEERDFTFWKTHHGPIVSRPDEQTGLAVRISGLFETAPMGIAMKAVRAENLTEFRRAFGSMQGLYMNVLYADRDGNIWYLYNARVPRRDPEIDWSQPVDGSDPALAWQGIHSQDELPQVLNPPAQFLQSCNSTPAITTDGANPDPADFPRYMIGDADQRKRRALRSLEILRGMNGVSFQEFQDAAFDTGVYWADEVLPRYAAEMKAWLAEEPVEAGRVVPYLDHLLAWDRTITADSTAATLCQAWYEKLHGTTYPGEELLEEYRGEPRKQLAALVVAAEGLSALHEDWRVPYGQLFRVQRRPRVGDLHTARFRDTRPSLESLGGHGPMGTVFTTYHTPSIDIPLVISQKRRYGVIGTAYLAAWEFGKDGVRGASAVPFGASGDPKSPHFFDQAELMAQRRMKPELFTEEEVLGGAVRSYHPGER